MEVLRIGRLEPYLVLFWEEIEERPDFALFVHVPAIRTVIESAGGGAGQTAFHAERVNFVSV